jgi:hypothetical protein
MTWIDRWAPGCIAAALLVTPLAGSAQGVTPSPDRGGDGGGPYERLIIRGATVIDGTGAPAIGPMDIVIEGNRIVQVRAVGVPGLPVDPARRPTGADAGDRRPRDVRAAGFVDLHAHQGGSSRGRRRSTCTSCGWPTA